MSNRSTNRLIMWGFIAVCMVMAGGLALLVVSTAVVPITIAAVNPKPTSTALPSATPTASATSEPLLSPTPSPTATPLISPTATQPPPPPQPSPTRFYIIPAQPTPIPTPVLPAAAAFPTSCDGPGRMNILLMGLDGWDNNYHRAARADTVILVGVNFRDKTAKMISFPRDLWVQMPGLPQVPEARLNSAYHYGELYGAAGGGPGQVSAVLANTFGLRVDRFAVVSFQSFIDGIDTIGGIDVNIPSPIRDEKYPLRDGSGTIVIEFPAGNVHLDGSNALIYARLRHDSSDFRRMRRQQQVLFAVRDRLLSPSTIPQLPALTQILLNSVRTNVSLEEMGLLGCLAAQINQSSITSWVIDNNMVEHTTLSDGAQVLMPKLDAIAPVLESFNAGE